MSSSGRSEDENDSGDHGDCGSRKISQKSIGFLSNIFLSASEAEL
jgi:hypothetical protein